MPSPAWPRSGTSSISPDASDPEAINGDLGQRTAPSLGGGGGRGRGGGGGGGRGGGGGGGRVGRRGRAAVDIAADVACSAQDVLDADPHSRAQLAFMISIDRRLFEHDGNLIAMLQDSRAEPELRAAYDRGRARADQIHRGVFNSWPGHWFRAGMGAADAADTYAALCNIGVYQVLTGERGWTPDQVQDWWHDSLSRLLLTGTPPPAGPPAERPSGRSQRPALLLRRRRNDHLSTQQYVRRQEG